MSETRSYEVLETRIEKGKITYKRIATLKPIANQIWDNRFNALMENDTDVATEGTLFQLVGSPLKPIMAGMLIREM